MRGLGAVAVTAEVRMEDIPDLAARVLPAAEEQHDVTGQQAARGHLDAEHHELVFIGQLGIGPRPSHPLLYLLTSHRLERHVAENLTSAAIGKHGIDVRRAERSKPEPTSTDREDR